VAKFDHDERLDRPLLRPAQLLFELAWLLFLNGLPRETGNSNPARFHKAKVTGHTALRRGLTQHSGHKALTVLRRNLYVAVRQFILSRE